MTTQVPVVVLGAAGYVGGELLRLLHHHPVLQLQACVSRSQAGRLLHEHFPHLPPGPARFCAPEQLDDVLGEAGPLALFSCAPHGQSARVLDDVLSRAEVRARTCRAVDLSADFRFADAETYREVYGQPHGAPKRLASFVCALPDLARQLPPEHVAHPGCFTTAVTLAAAPLVAQPWCLARLVASAVTGSTGSGREPSARTHHPDRHANLAAYGPLHHRHTGEMESLLQQLAGSPVQVDFIPHSGPFARGIHATVWLELQEPRTAQDLAALMQDFYASTPFVSVSTQPPSLKHVLGTNRCQLAVATRERSVVVMAVIDNLTKGAAGGAVQWMNRLLDLDQASGLELPGLGWV